jgi:two-component system LytT family response regulator
VLRALIVDDERLAREKVRRFLSVEDDIQVVGECGTGLEAVETILRERPDLLFLDVQMPGFDGFRVLQEVGADPARQVVFITAHDEHAVRAFEVEALDYLLKPFDAARFRQALARARSRPQGLQPRQVESLLARLRHGDGRRPARLVVRSGGRIVLVPVQEIDWVEAADNYVRLHAGGQDHLLRETMATMEARLDPRRFLRIHRCSIVNLERVAELRHAPHGDLELVLRSGKTLPIGRSYRDDVVEALGA